MGVILYVGILWPQRTIFFAPSTGLMGKILGKVEVHEDMSTDSCQIHHNAIIFSLKILDFN